MIPERPVDVMTGMECIRVGTTFPSAQKAIGSEVGPEPISGTATGAQELVEVQPLHGAQRSPHLGHLAHAPDTLTAGITEQGEGDVPSGLEHVE
jgi:hypothetical protein